VSIVREGKRGEFPLAVRGEVLFHRRASRPLIREKDLDARKAISKGRSGGCIYFVGGRK